MKIASTAAVRDPADKTVTQALQDHGWSSWVVEQGVCATCITACSKASATNRTCTSPTTRRPSTTSSRPVVRGRSRRSGAGPVGRVAPRAPWLAAVAPGCGFARNRASNSPNPIPLIPETDNMMQLPARYDHVGTPAPNTCWRRAPEGQGEISPAAARRRGQAIGEIVKFQQDVGLKSGTDGRVPPPTSTRLPRTVGGVKTESRSPSASRTAPRNWRRR